MPKIVDHDQRRRELSQALWRVAESHGTDAVSLRTVAAEAGWSTGALRHYFATREELLEFALEDSARHVTRRIQERAAALSDETPRIERLAALVDELLPLDGRRRTELLIWQAVGKWSRHDTELARRIWSQQRDFYHDLLIALWDRPPRPPQQGPADQWTRRWAEYLHTFVDGLANQMVGAPTEMPSERARAVLRRFLADMPAPAASAPS